MEKNTTEKEKQNIWEPLNMMKGSKWIKANIEGHKMQTHIHRETHTDTHKADKN